MMPADFADTGSQRRKLTFDPTINLGHILTAAAMLASGFAAYNTLDKRVAVIEVQHSASKENQALKDSSQDLMLRESVLRIQETLTRLDQERRNSK
jgi:hypothetical protein